MTFDEWYKKEIEEFGWFHYEAFRSCWEEAQIELAKDTISKLGETEAIIKKKGLRNDCLECLFERETY